MNFVLGKKIEMSQIFNDKGDVMPVTLVEAGPCKIAQVKKEDGKDGYTAVQIGFDKKKRMSGSLRGHLKDLENFRWLREFRFNKQEKEELKLKRGDKITVDTFEVGEKVKIVGTSKGKGFQGVVKRHGFHGQHASHGHKDQERAPGSIGPTEPARVFKGMRMPGQMGNARVTVKNLEIVKIDGDKNILYIKGAVPGARGSLVMIVGEGELKVNQEKTTNKKQESTDNKEAPTPGVGVPTENVGKEKKSEEKPGKEKEQEKKQKSKSS